MLWAIITKCSCITLLTKTGIYHQPHLHVLMLMCPSDVNLLLCTGFCSPDQYRCGVFFFPTCINSTLVCNGEFDCFFSSSDEQGCGMFKHCIIYLSSVVLLSVSMDLGLDLIYFILSVQRDAYTNMPVLCSKEVGPAGQNVHVARFSAVTIVVGNVFHPFISK